jgi:hypothetical protein
MVRTSLLSIALLAFLPGFAQKNYKRQHYQMLDQARQFHGGEEYEQAARFYKKLLPVDTTFAIVAHEYAVCLTNIPGMKDHAAPWFERAVRHNHTEAYFELGLSRHRQMRFAESIELMERYKKLNHRVHKDAEVDRYIAISRNAQELVKTTVDVGIMHLGALINSSAHDYCPLVTADGSTMYFTSRRGARGAMKDISGQYYEDIFVARQVNGIWQRAENAGAVLNTPGHDATVGLNPDGSSMIIYRAGRDNIAGSLYESILHEGKWQQPVVMTDKINTRHHEPSAGIAPGGQEIYFSSDRPGGYGGRDLYRIRRLPNGQWSLPLNLGPNINTPFDEDAPFMHSDGSTLFFSSNGHNTMGGFDIFKAVLMDADMNGWGRPVNMGHPLNTVNDDIYFSLNADGQTGYFSSERPGGMGMQDIYQINFAGSQLDHVYVRGVVADALDEPVRARIVLTDMEEEVIGVYNTNEGTGRFMMLMTRNEPFHVTVEAPGFATTRMEIHALPDDPITREMMLDIHMISKAEHERLSRTENQDGRGAPRMSFPPFRSTPASGRSFSPPGR